MTTTQLPSKAAIRELAAELESCRVNVMAAHEGDPTNWRSTDAARKENCQLLGIFAKNLGRLNRWLTMVVGGSSSLTRQSADLIREFEAWHAAHDNWLATEPQPPGEGKPLQDLPGPAVAGYQGNRAHWADHSPMEFWRSDLIPDLLRAVEIGL